MNIFRSCQRFFLALFLFGVLLDVAWAAQSFTVNHIRVLGLQRVQYKTVLNYLPIHIGQTVTEQDTAAILKALYQTNFFDNAWLDRESDTLVIHVVERPTIGSISVSGNKDIPSKSINDVLKKLDLVQGRILNRVVLDQIRHELKKQYDTLGKYNARITVNITPLPRNRVNIVIKISEGASAKIKSIHIIGNNAFSDDELEKLFVFKTNGFLLFFTKKDQYSKEKLDASLKLLREFYLDHGYIKMDIVSTQVSMTPDRKAVYVTVKISEGDRYKFKGFSLAGNMVLPQEQLNHLVTIHSGTYFSKEVVRHSVMEMGNALGDAGYAFPSINAEPQIDEVNKTVFIIFQIDAKNRYYVRRINFEGNVKTADYVLRHAVHQEEAAPLSLRKVKESQRQLRILSFFENVNVNTVPIPETTNQVDLNYKVKEKASAVASLQAGYSRTLGFIINASFQQPNFLGTGKAVGISFSTDNWSRVYSVNYYNPFYTASGIGRGLSTYFEQVHPKGFGDVAVYHSDKYSISQYYTFPMGDVDSLRAGYGYSYYNVISRAGISAPQQISFLNTFGHLFHQANLTVGWEHNSYDKFPFPEHGLHQALDLLVAVPINDHGLKYYKATYIGQFYQPLFAGFILSPHVNLGYGNDYADNSGLPFFENFYAGGIGSQGQVRGFLSYSLGPQDTSVFMNALGGNLLVSGGIDLILPPPISRDSLRTMVFIDAGNVYDLGIPAAFRGIHPGPIRYSAGIGVIWQSPMGPIMLSVAKPLNRQGDIYSNQGVRTRRADKAQPFQFTISSGF